MIFKPHRLINLMACIGFTLGLSCSSSVYAQTAADFRILDLPFANSDKESISSKVLKWDGLVKTPEFGDIMSTDMMSARVAELQAKNDQLPMPTILRFYPRGVLREVYRIDFYYQDYEDFAGLRIIYRPFDTEYSNQPEGIDVDSVMKQLTPRLGAPTKRIKRIIAGFPSYNAYVWEDDTFRILVDREAQQPGKPVILQLRVKDTDIEKQYMLND